MKTTLPANLTDSLTAIATKISRYKLLIFILLVAVTYGYIVFTISSLSGAQPTEEQISQESNPIRSAKIDEKAVQQLQQLQDNSVSVKALFNEARNNPFQEN